MHESVEWQRSDLIYVKFHFAWHFWVESKVNEVLAIWLIVFVMEANYGALNSNFSE